RRSFRKSRGSDRGVARRVLEQPEMESIRSGGGKRATRRPGPRRPAKRRGSTQTTKPPPGSPSGDGSTRGRGSGDKPHSARSEWLAFHQKSYPRYLVIY